jgi:hypothetical protein
MGNKKEQKIWSESSVTPFPGGWIYPDHPNANVEYIESLNYQEGGTHYKKYAIQPIEYIHANKLDFFQGSVVKYITRFRDKNGLEDLKKAKHFIDLLINLEYNNDQSGSDKDNHEGSQEKQIFGCNKTEAKK